MYAGTSEDTGAPRTIVLPDGRRLAWMEYGAPFGQPLLYCHGFPSSSLEARFTEYAAAARGIRVIAPDRPGYGHSDPAPAQPFADWATDVGVLLDALGCDRVAVLGVSGGAPHALACCVMLRRRIAGVSLVAPLGPLADIGTTAGLSGLGRLSAHLAREHPGAQAALFRVLGLALRMAPSAVFPLLAPGNPAADRALLRDRDTRAIWIDALRNAVRQGAAAAIHDMRRYVAPWGFALESVACPVCIWHGHSDTVVPPMHGRVYAARLPHACAHWMPGEGHFSVPVQHVDAILSELSACLPA